MADSELDKVLEHCCNTCGQVKPQSAFNRDKKSKTGFAYRCRDCNRIRCTQFYQKNTQNALLKSNEYRRTHPNESRVYRARWRHKNRQYASDYQKRRLHDNPMLGRMYASRRRARIRNQFVEDIDPQSVLKYCNYICGICGNPIEDVFHIDHIKPLVKGGLHSYANVQPAHPHCNLQKGASYDE